MKSSDKKTALSIVATTKFQVKRNVTVQNVEMRTYHSKNSTTGKESEYYRYILVVGDNDGNSIFGSQMIFCLDPKKDTAVPAIEDVKPGTRGILTFEMEYFVKDEAETTDKETGEKGKIPFTRDADISVIDFEPETAKKKGGSKSAEKAV